MMGFGQVHERFIERDQGLSQTEKLLAPNLKEMLHSIIKKVPVPMEGYIFIRIDEKSFPIKTLISLYPKEVIGNKSPELKSCWKSIQIKTNP